MADYDSNIIKPVEGLPNIAGITGAKGREQRKRRQHPPDETTENTQRRKSTDEQNADKSEVGKNKSDRDAIDYCA
jgi:hypothetical protein